MIVRQKHGSRSVSQRQKLRAVVLQFTPQRAFKFAPEPHDLLRKPQCSSPAASLRSNFTSSKRSEHQVKFSRHGLAKPGCGKAPYIGNYGEHNRYRSRNGGMEMGTGTLILLCIIMSMWDLYRCTCMHVRHCTCSPCTTINRHVDGDLDQRRIPLPSPHAKARPARRFLIHTLRLNPSNTHLPL